MEQLTYTKMKCFLLLLLYILFPLCSLVSLALIFVQDAVSEIIDHSGQPLSQGNLRLPVEKLFCFTNIWLPLMRIVSRVWFEFDCCTRIDGFFDNLSFQVWKNSFASTAKKNLDLSL